MANEKETEERGKGTRFGGKIFGNGTEVNGTVELGDRFKWESIWAHIKCFADFLWMLKNMSRVLCESLYLL